MYGELVSNSPAIHGTLSGSGRVEGSPLSLSTQQAVYLLRLPLDPVYVEDAGGSEILRYREADMVEGRLYKVRWHGERYAVLRSGDGVEILKFYPDEK